MNTNIEECIDFLKLTLRLWQLDEIVKHIIIIINAFMIHTQE